MAVHSSLENPMDGGAWWATVHGVTKGRTRLSDSTSTSTSCTGGAVVQNALANAGGAGDQGSIPGLGRSPGGGMATHSSILAWKIRLVGYSPWGRKRRTLTPQQIKT